MKRGRVRRVDAYEMQQSCFKEISSGKRWQTGRFGHGNKIIIFIDDGKRPGRIGFDPGWALPDKFASPSQYAFGMRQQIIDEHAAGQNARLPLRAGGMSIAPAKIPKHRSGVAIKADLFPVFTAVIIWGVARSQLFTKTLFIHSHDVLE